MLKKIALIALTGVLLLTCVSCGSKNGQETPIKNKESVSVKESELYSNYQLEEAAVSQKADFEKDGIKAVMSGITYEDVVTKINFSLKNDTDKKVKIVTTDLSINGLMCTDAMMIDVEAKSEKSGFIEISNEWFAEMNIGTVKDIEYVIRVYNEQSEEIFKSEALKVTTKASEDYQQKYDEEGFVIYNQDGILLAARELKKSKLSNDMELTFYVVNNTEHTFSVMANDVSVNGTPIEPTFVITVAPGKKAVDSMLFLEKDMTTYRISEFKTVKAKFKAVSDSLETVFETDAVEIPVQ